MTQKDVNDLWHAIIFHSVACQGAALVSRTCKCSYRNACLESRGIIPLSNTQIVAHVYKSCVQF